jgi:hypothetical protein
MIQKIDEIGSRMAGEPDASEDAAELTSFLEVLLKRIAEEVKNLAVDRIVANHRTVPLLREADAGRIIRALVNSDTMDETLEAVEFARSMIQRQIAAELSGLMMNDTDPYAAFWKQAMALLTIATQAGVTPEQMAKDINLRTEFYRATVTRTGWRRHRNQMITMVTGLNMTALLGPSLAGDDEWKQIELELADGDLAVAGPLKEMANAIRSHFNRREKEIWLASTVKS